MEDRFTYGLNPEKLGAVSSYLCDQNTAPAEFLLVKSQYHAETGRAVSRGALFFQIRQAFLPGEVTAEEANRIGYAEYRDAQRKMREAVAIKANIDHLLGITDERENKAQER